MSAAKVFPAHLVCARAGWPRAELFRRPEPFPRTRAEFWPRLACARRVNPICVARRLPGATHVRPVWRHSQEREGGGPHNASKRNPGEGRGRAPLTRSFWEILPQGRPWICAAESTYWVPNLPFPAKWGRNVIFVWIPVTLGAREQISFFPRTRNAAAPKAIQS